MQVNAGVNEFWMTVSVLSTMFYLVQRLPDHLRTQQFAHIATTVVVVALCLNNGAVEDAELALKHIRRLVVGVPIFLNVHTRREILTVAVLSIVCQTGVLQHVFSDMFVINVMLVHNMVHSLAIMIMVKSSSSVVFMFAVFHAVGVLSALETHGMTVPYRVGEGNFTHLL